MAGAPAMVVIHTACSRTSLQPPSGTSISVSGTTCVLPSSATVSQMYSRSHLLSRLSQPQALLFLRHLNFCKLILYCVPGVVLGALRLLICLTLMTNL